MSFDVPSEQFYSVRKDGYAYVPQTLVVKGIEHELSALFSRDPSLAARYPALTKSVLLFVFGLENYVVDIAGEPHYRYDDEGGFVGLGQFNERTWKGLNKVYGDDFSLSFDIAPELIPSIRATIYLIMNNSDQYYAKTRERLTDARVVYLYHNQGGPSAFAYLSGESLAYPDQSEKALAVFKEIRYG